MHVVDLGGTTESWRRASVSPRRVTVVNLKPQTPDPESGLDTIQTDACELDVEALAGQFDLIYCNSVVEHVGGHARRRQLSDAIHRVAPRHWVQAPYRYFLVEPHWLFPGLQFLPLATRARIVRHWPLGPRQPPDMATAVSDVADVELPSKTEMRFYFPGSVLVRETLAPRTKSLLAEVVDRCWRERARTEKQRSV